MLVLVLAVMVIGDPAATVATVTMAEEGETCSWINALLLLSNGAEKDEDEDEDEDNPRNEDEDDDPR